jgi:hypothetical protein
VSGALLIEGLLVLLPLIDRVIGYCVSSTAGVHCTLLTNYFVSSCTSMVLLILKGRCSRSAVWQCL